MSYGRDKDIATRGAGAIAARDKAHPHAAVARARARARQVSARDRALASLTYGPRGGVHHALGKIDSRGSGGTSGGSGGTTSPAPTSAPTSGSSTWLNRIVGQSTAPAPTSAPSTSSLYGKLFTASPTPTTSGSLASKLFTASPAPKTLAEKLFTSPTTKIPTVPQPPRVPNKVPTRADVRMPGALTVTGASSTPVLTAPTRTPTKIQTTPSSSGGGGGGGGGGMVTGGGGGGAPIELPPEIEVPDVPAQAAGSASKITGKHLAIAGAIGVGAYLLLRKKKGAP